MKTLTRIACLALFLIGISANAALYNCCETVLAGGTVNVVGGGTNTYTDKVIDGSKQENVGLELSFKSTATNVLNLTLSFLAALDSSAAPNSGPAYFTWVVAGNGTNTVRVTTNMPTLGYGRFLLSSVLNGNADTAITNISLRYAIKRTD